MYLLFHCCPIKVNKKNKKKLGNIILRFYKIHLFNLIQLFKFSENPYRDWIIDRLEIENC